MKRILAFLVLAALSATVTAQAQTSNPPLVKDVPATALEPYIYKLKETGNEAGAAKAMVDAIDASHNLRNGACRSNLAGQSVYYEQYNIHGSLLAQVDSVQLQSIWEEGQARKTGYAFTSREWTGKNTYVENIEYMDEGFFRTASALVSLQKQDGDKAKQKVGSAMLQVFYTPMQVHFKKLEQLSEVREGGTCEAELLLTDVKNLYAMDGYTIEVSSSNTGILIASPAQVTTGSDGTAKIKLRGVKQGTATLKVLIDLHQDETNSSVHAEREIDIEVKEAERWEYTIKVKDEFFIQPAQQYTLTGTFTVKSFEDEAGITHYTLEDVSPASKSDAGTFEATGMFFRDTDRDSGVAIMFDMMGIIARAEESKATMGAKIGQVLADTFMSMATGEKIGETVNSRNPITCAEFLLEEGSWSYYADMNTIMAIGMSAQGMSDEEIQKALAQSPEERNSSKSKNKKLNPDDFKVDPEASRQANISYIKKHNCLIIPDTTQGTLFQMGNIWKEADKYMSTGKSSDSISGTFILRQLNND